MVAFLRQFLVVLLVLLQSAAPLVHAHTGGKVSQYGLHLHEFEALHLVADSVALTAFGHAISADSSIVDLGSAIKQQTTTDDHSFSFYLFGNDPVFAIARDSDVINFSPHISGFVLEPFLSHNTSRAPPLYS
jgi:hypothetical protein